MEDLSLGFFPTNGMNPWTGYGKLEMGTMSGLIKSGITIDNGAPIMLVIGYAEWLEHDRFKDGKTRLWLYTMSESTRVSAEWVAIINARAERVLVPAPGLIDVYRESGVTRPIDWIGAGVDMSPPPYVRHEAGTPFTFVGYSVGDNRKGIEHVVMQFTTLFQRDPAYRLVIKSRERSWLDGCKEPNIEIIRGEISEKGWYAILHRGHCFLYPSRAEGWGMPPREAVLAGVPTLATQWLGMWDADKWAIPIPVGSFSQVDFNQYHANAREALWAEPDIDALREGMGWVVDHYADAIAHVDAGRAYLLGGHTWAHVGGRIRALLEAHL